MNKPQALFPREYFRHALRFAIALSVSMSYGKTEVPVFLLSGQSNMVGMGSVNDLTADQKKITENVKINVDADCDPSKKGKWLPLGPGFGNGASNFGPELFFGKTLADSMADRKIAFIKNAVNGAPLGTSGGYMPPSSSNGTGGQNYRNMMNHVGKAMESFHTAFDTSEYSPRWAGFVWLQGESDAMQGGSLANDYEANLENLIGDIRVAVETPDLPVILPLITTSSLWKECDKIRGADVTMIGKLENIDTMETKGFQLPDNMHYNAEGLVKIGRVCALRWLAMEYDYGDPVPVVRRGSDRSGAISRPRMETGASALFDLSGRLLTVSRTVHGSGAALPAFTIRKPESPSNKSAPKRAVVVR